MKKLLYILCVSLSFMLVACDKSSEDPSFITYYADFTMEGDEVLTLPLGTEYVEPGVTATEKGVDVTSKIVTIGVDKINKDEVGVYTVTYSVANKDGYPSSIERTVVMYDPAITADISGEYTTGDGTKRILTDADGKEVITSFDGYGVTITQIAPGVFEVSDLIGGYYEQKQGYGSAYAMFGYIKLNADNTLSILSGDVAGFGDSYDDFVDATYNPNVVPEDGTLAGSIKWTTIYAGMDFIVVLDKPVKE